jgi:uncharacterized membrane protein YadS
VNRHLCCRCSGDGQRVAAFIPAFLLVYLLSLLVFAAGAWDQAVRYNLEPPLVALIPGLAISNLVGLPAWFDAGFRVEFFIKTGIVLLGATLPFTLILWAGPAFTFSFLGIGLSTRYRALAPAGRKPLLAFGAGVAVNVALGYVLSVVVFGAHWAAISR